MASHFHRCYPRSQEKIIRLAQLGSGVSLWPISCGGGGRHMAFWAAPSRDASVAWVGKGAYERS